MNKFENLTKYLSLLNENNLETREGDRLLSSFVKDVYDFDEKNEDFELRRYIDILEANGLEWGSKAMSEADVSDLDAQCVMALIMGAVRAERFCDDSLLEFFENGSIRKWLERLNEFQK